MSLYLADLPASAREVIATALSETQLTEDSLGESADAQDYAVDVITRLARTFLPDHPDLAAFTD